MALEVHIWCLHCFLTLLTLLPYLTQMCKDLISIYIYIHTSYFVACSLKCSMSMYSQQICMLTCCPCMDPFAYIHYVYMFVYVQIICPENHNPLLQILYRKKLPNGRVHMTWCMWKYVKKFVEIAAQILNGIWNHIHVNIQIFLSHVQQSSIIYYLFHVIINYWIFICKWPGINISNKS